MISMLPLLSSVYLLFSNLIMSLLVTNEWSLTTSLVISRVNHALFINTHHIYTKRKYVSRADVWGFLHIDTYWDCKSFRLELYKGKLSSNNRLYNISVLFLCYVNIHNASCFSLKCINLDFLSIHHGYIWPIS